MQTQLFFFFSLYCLTPRLSAPYYLLSSVYCGWLGSAVYRDQNSLVSWIFIWQFEVLCSDALPANNQQCRHCWNLSDDRLVPDLNPRPPPCSQMHLTTRPPHRLFTKLINHVKCWRLMWRTFVEALSRRDPANGWIISVANLSINNSAIIYIYLL